MRALAFRYLFIIQFIVKNKKVLSKSKPSLMNYISTIKYVQAEIQTNIMDFAF